MTRKRKRRSSVVEIGNGPARIKIYTMNRRDGYPEFTLAWKEAGRRKTRSFASMEEARMIGQQISVRIINGSTVADEATKRDIDLLRHCERVAMDHGVSLSAALDEWASARKAAGEIPLSDAVRFYQANRADLFAVRTNAQVAAEFVVSLKRKGVSDIYVRNATSSLKRFTDTMPGNIADVSVADINRFLDGLKKLGPVSKNGIRRNLVTMFGFAKKQGYLHPDRKTSAEQSDSFKEPEKEIEIFTPEEMEKILLAAHARILPLIAIGGFCGIRSAEVGRLTWQDIKWDRGHIEIAGHKAKTAARRLVPLPENLKAWLAPWRGETGPILTISDVSGALGDTALKAKIPGGWRQNALRHSFISYRVSMTGDVARTSLEAGNSPKMIFRHYREIVDEEAARTWFAITPPDGWIPSGLKLSLRDRLVRALAQHETPCVDSTNGGQDRTPPVMIIVCDNTDIAEEFYRKISGEEIIEADVESDEDEDEDDDAPKRRKKKPKAQKRYGKGDIFPELLSNRAGAEVSLRIDSKLLAAAESEDPNTTKKEAAEQLRKIVSTVGRVGEAGEHIRCVVSVNMLSEGWDANNVTHILGLRALFSNTSTLAWISTG